MAEINTALASNVSRIGAAIPNKLDSQVQKGSGPDFKDLLGAEVSKQIKKTEEVVDLKFSKHAIERMQARGITLKPEQMISLSEAVKKAGEKGAKETLVLMDNAAFVVSPKNNTVITAIDRALMKENLFTNIDSTIVI